jgi:hypothetical protein
MNPQISVRTIVVAAKHQLTCDLADEAAILHVDSGQYYGLDAVGARIWQLIQQPRSAAAIRDTILEEYDVEPDRCEHDLLALLESLAGAGLIEVRGEAPPASAESAF